MAKKKKTKKKATKKAAKKDAVAAPPVRVKSWDALIKETNQGIRIIADACDTCNEVFVPRITTWRMNLDVALGGGILDGHITQFWGAPEGGKTTTLYATLASLQRTCRQCYTPIIDFRDFETGETKTTCNCGACEYRRVLLFSPEGRFDSAWAKRAGIMVDAKGQLDKDYFRRADAFSIEQVGSILTRFIEVGALDCVAIDPIAQLQAEANLSNSNQQGRHAYAVQMLNAKILAAQARHGLGVTHKVDKALEAQYGAIPFRCTILYTNQVRMKIGVMFGDPTTTTGGENLKHIVSTNIRFMAGEVNKCVSSDDAKVLMNNISKDIKVKVPRNTFGAGGATAAWRVYLDNWKTNRAGDTNEHEVAYNLSNENVLGLIASAKGGSATFMGIPFKNKTAIKEALRGHDLLWAIRAVIFSTSLSASARDYLLLKRFDYNPFYALHINTEEHDGRPILKSAGLTRRKPLEPAAGADKARIHRRIKKKAGEGAGSSVENDESGKETAASA